MAGGKAGQLQGVTVGAGGAGGGVPQALEGRPVPAGAGRAGGGAIQLQPL